MNGRDRQFQLAIKEEVLPHLDALHRYGLYLTKDRVNAEELSQETLVKAIRSFAQYQRGTNCKAWLFKIMMNTFLNSQRRKNHQVELDDAMIAPDDGTPGMLATSAGLSPEESYVSMLSRTQVRQAIEKLPPEFRSVVVLCDLEEFSYREIAEILECPIGTVMSRLHRGRKNLRRRLESYAREIGILEELPADGESEDRDEELLRDDEGKVTAISAYRNKGADSEH